MPFPLSDNAQRVIARNAKMLRELGDVDPSTLVGYITVLMEIDPLTGDMRSFVHSGGSLDVRHKMMEALADHEPLNPTTNVIEPEN